MAQKSIPGITASKGMTKRQREATLRKTAVLIHKQNPGVSMEEAKQRAAKAMGVKIKQSPPPAKVPASVLKRMSGGGGGAGGPGGMGVFDKRIGQFIRRKPQGSGTFTGKEINRGFRKL